jgi:hypothetical protein
MILTAETLARRHAGRVADALWSAAMSLDWAFQDANRAETTSNPSVREQGLRSAAGYAQHASRHLTYVTGK